MIIAGLLLVDPNVAPRPGWIETAGDRITRVEHGDPPEAPDLGGGDALVCPGFIDAHLHLPQVDCIGCDGLELLDWLERVIFPAEIAWAQPDFAEAHARTAYRRMLEAGTLGYAGYLTSHFESIPAVTRAAHRLPLRGFAGQSLMDRHGPPELLGQSIARLNRSQRGRFEATVNPRFAVSCSDEMLATAAQRAGDDRVIQTHLAESRRECELVRELFPDDPHYTAVYDRHGLLTERTLLAHCIHLDDAEWALIARRRSVVVHCPAANTFLGAGRFDLSSARRHGVRLALGSDVAAGPDLAMPRVARAMIETAKHAAFSGGDPGVVPTPADAWRLITAGNADALGWPDADRLEPGASADVLVLDPPLQRDEHLIGRLIYTWRNDYITARVVAGNPP